MVRRVLQAAPVVLWPILVTVVMAFINRWGAYIVVRIVHYWTSVGKGLSTVQFVSGELSNASIYCMTCDFYMVTLRRDLEQEIRTQM